MTNEQRLEAAIAAAMKAGKHLMSHYRDTLAVTTKESVRDLSTPVDHGAEQAAFSVLREVDPAAVILSEELGLQGTDTGAGHWVVDALDGTVNYLHHVPFFSVSIAWVQRDQPVVGAVYVRCGFRSKVLATPEPPGMRAPMQRTKTPLTFCSKCSSVLRLSRPTATTSPLGAVPMPATMFIRPFT